MLNRIRLAVTGGLALIIILCVIYFSVISASNTPEGTIKLIEEAVATHDKEKFDKYVDVDNLLNTSYDSFVDGMISADTTMSEEVKSSVMNFTQILKVPMIASMKAGIDNYINTGSFTDNSKINSEEKSADEHQIALSEVLERAGIDKLEYRQVDKAIIDKDDENKAIVEVIAFQKETAKDFIFEVEMQRDDKGDWRVKGIKNFRNFINMMNQTRREQLDKYLEDTASIINRHDKTIREAEQKYGSILSSGSLGKDDTRVDLKTLMTDVVKKDWEVRKQELFNVSVPKGAEALQNLRIKICDLSIESAELYSKWMEDKKASTIKDADDKHKQVQNLLEEEKFLVNRMTK